MTYTPEKDVIQPLSDGSGTVVVARAGVPIAWAFARVLGLVEGDEPKEEKPKARERKP